MCCAGSPTRGALPSWRLTRKSTCLLARGVKSKKRRRRFVSTQISKRVLYQRSANGLARRSAAQKVCQLSIPSGEQYGLRTRIVRWEELLSSSCQVDGLRATAVVAHLQGCCSLTGRREIGRASCRGGV